MGLQILSILAESGLSPRRLEIEITESALVQNLEGAQQVLGALRDAGVRIALTDFGTGYSSLYHLRNFKVDKIKSIAASSTTWSASPRRPRWSVACWDLAMDWD